MLCPWDVAEVEVKESDPGDPTSDECSRQVCRRHVQLRDQSTSIQFESESNSVEVKSKLPQGVQHSAAFSFASVVASFCWRPDTAFVPRRVLFPITDLHQDCAPPRDAGVARKD